MAEPFMFQGPNFSYTLEITPPRMLARHHKDYMILVPKPTQMCNCFILGAWRIILSDLDTWLGSPPFFSHEKAIWKGNNPIFRELTITMVNNHLLNGVILQVVGWIQFIMLDLDKLATRSASHQSHHEQKNRKFHDGLQCLSITKGSIIH